MPLTHQPDTSDIERRKLPWLVGTMGGTVTFFATLFTIVAAGFCIYLVFQGYTLGLIEWIFLVGGGLVSGLLAGALFWLVYSKPVIAAQLIAQNRRDHSN